MSPAQRGAFLALARRRATRSGWFVIGPLLWVEHHATDTAFLLAPVALRAAWVAALCVLQLAVATATLLIVGIATAAGIARRYHIDEHLGNHLGNMGAFCAQHTRAGALATARNLRTLAATRCGFASYTIFTAISSSSAGIARMFSCVLFAASCAFGNAVHFAGTTAGALAAAPAHAAARISRPLRGAFRLYIRAPFSGGAAILRQLPATVTKTVTTTWPISISITIRIVIRATCRLCSLSVTSQSAKLAGRLLGRLGAAGAAAACFVTQPCAARICPLAAAPLSSMSNACFFADSRAAPPRARSTWWHCARRAAAARDEDDYTLFRLLRPP